MGALCLLAVATHTALSGSLAASEPSPEPVSLRKLWFGQLEHSLSVLPSFLTEALHGAGPLATESGFLWGYCSPLLVETSAALALLGLLHRRRDELCDDDARRVLGWALGFTALSVPAFNVLTQDLWLSVAWGRMANHGMNPFAGPYPLALAADLPLDYDPMPMTYGPCWAIVCSFAAAVSGGAPLVCWLLLKLVLGCAWAVCLWMVSELARPHGPWRRTLAIVVTGWLPLGVHCGVAEGHNDVLMIAGALLWVRTLQGRSAAGPLLLTASILTKYVTLPLALVDLVYHLGARSMSVGRYLARILPACFGLLAGSALVARSLRGFGETAAMHDWKFLDPADVFRLLGRYAGWTTDPTGVLIVAAIFGCVAMLELLRLGRAATHEQALRAQLALMAVVLFACTGHVWPWFFVWCLPLAALAPSFWLSWFVIGAACVAPFTIVHWARLGVEGPARSELPSLVMYGAALAATAAYLRLRASPSATSRAQRAGHAAG